MQIVIDHGGAQRELDLEIEHPHACVADLVTAVDADLTGTGAGVVAEGRWFGPDIGLDEIGLYEGAVLSIGHRPRSRRPAPMARRLPSSEARWRERCTTWTDAPWSSIATRAATSSSPTLPCPRATLAWSPTAIVWW